MRKQIITEHTQGFSPAEPQDWLDLEHLIQVEMTSEDTAHTIESALVSNTGSGWRAQLPGKQTIRLLFDTPHRISRIQLVFQEDELERTQEFVLRWSRGIEEHPGEIVRQQYNFSPPGNTRELEDYFVDLEALTILELEIIPDISGGGARASLEQLRLA
ncbi:MAG: hypothetical protein WBO34_03240 [Gammaproteobacteria bacterium]